MLRRRTNTPTTRILNEANSDNSLMTKPNRPATLQVLSYTTLLLAIGWAAYKSTKTPGGRCASAACGYADLLTAIEILLIPFGALLIAIYLNIASFRMQAAPRTRAHKVKLWLHMAALVCLLLWGADTFVL